MTSPLGWAAVTLAIRRLIGDVGLAPRDDGRRVGLHAHLVRGLRATTLGASSLVVLVAGAFAVCALARDGHRTVCLLVGTAAAYRTCAVVVIVGWFAIATFVVGSAQVAAFVEPVPRLAGMTGGASDLTPAGSLGAAPRRRASCSWLRRASGSLGRRTVLGSRQTGPRRSPGCSSWRRSLGITTIAWDHFLTALLRLVVGVVAESAVLAIGLLGAGLTNAAWGSGVMLFAALVLELVVHLRGRGRGADA